MPSPFPGMDPYLEKPSLWPDVHHELISGARAYLGGLVRPKYFVRVEERVYLADDEKGGQKSHPRVPDLRIGEHPGHGGAPFTPGSGTTVLEAAEPVAVLFPVEEEARETFLQVFDADSRQIVTVIEILSPTIKLAGSRGRASFEQKRLEVLNSSRHWVEIDLLRAGTPSLPRELSPPCDYAAHVLRVERRPESHLWPILLRQKLPVIPIPLKAGDPDALLNLQAVLNDSYDRANYDLVIDYRADPVPPLAEVDAAWADQWLKAKGVR